MERAGAVGGRFALALLRTAEIVAWMAVSFAVFLALRVTGILLSLVNPGFCEDSCELGSFLVQVVVGVFVAGWLPLVLVGFIAYVKRHRGTAWWIPTVVAGALTYAVAMLFLVGLFASFVDSNSRNELIPLAGLGSDLGATLALVGAGLLMWRDDRKRRKT